MEEKIYYNKSPRCGKTNLSEVFQPLHYDSINYNNNLNNTHFITNYNNNNNFRSQQESSTLEIVLPVKIKSDKHDDWLKDLKVTVMNSYSNITITITDSEDPLFLYKVCLSEAEFQQLKQTQHLVIDFQQFPSKLIEMLELCKETVLNNNMLNTNNNLNLSILKASSTFCCIIEERTTNISLLEADLIIQELTQLRALNHIKLNMKTPNDTILKKHVAVLCMDFKKKSEQLYEENKNFKESLDKATLKILELNEEFKNYNQQKQHEIKDFKLDHEKTIMEIKNSHNEEIKAINKKHEDTVYEIDIKLKNEIQMLKDELKTISDKNTNLSETLNKANYDKRQLELNNDSIDKEIIFLRKENETLKSENKELTVVKYNQEKSVSELEIKIKSALDSIKDKEEMIKQNEELIDSLKKTRIQQEEKYKFLKDKIEVASNDIKTGNSVIEKLYNDLQNERSKRKEKAEAYNTQEMLIKTLNANIEEMTKQNNEDKREIIKKDEELKQLKFLLEQEQKKVAECKKVIEENEVHLMYFNKKLNEKSTPLSTFISNNNSNNAATTKDYYSNTSNNYNLGMNTNSHMKTNNDLTSTIKENYNVSGTNHNFNTKFSNFDIGTKNHTNNQLSTNNEEDNDTEVDFIQPYTNFSGLNKKNNNMNMNMNTTNTSSTTNAYKKENINTNNNTNTNNNAFTTTNSSLLNKKYGNSNNMIQMNLNTNSNLNNNNNNNNNINSIYTSTNNSNNNTNRKPFYQNSTNTNMFDEEDKPRTVPTKKPLASYLNSG